MSMRGDDNSGAIFSGEPEPVYRYVLWRRWREGDVGRVCFVMLNPSTADEQTNDATIRRCLGYANTWGYDGLTVCNLYGYRATDPRALRKIADPVGPDNDRILESYVRSAALVVCAWGAHGEPRGAQISPHLVAWARNPLHALGVTKLGAPRHPLRLAASLSAKPWMDAEGMYD